MNDKKTNNEQTKPRKRLVVIDGKSVFYRGYYALPNLATKDGRPTGGVYGFAVMGLQILKKMNPDFVAVAWDKPKTNIKRRREIYPEYKANRKPAPPDFYEQIPILHELLEAFDWPFYEVDNHEADDIMAAFTEQAQEKGYESILISSDHDLLQLVDDDTVVAILKKGLTNIDYFDPKRFADKYQMTPEQFIDYKALRGDPSDNLPGVKGVGEKTATKLIMDYGGLDGVYEHIDEVKGTLRQKLIDDKDMAYMTKKLVILEKDVGLTIDWKAADSSKANGTKIAEKLAELEFKSLLAQLPDEMKQTLEDIKSANSFKSEAEVTSVNTLGELEAMKLGATKQIVVETFVAGPVNTDLKTVILSPDPKQAFIVQMGEITDELLAKKLDTELADAKIIAYDTKYSLKSLLQAGVAELGVEHDIRMGAFLINSLVRDQSLAGLAGELGYEGEPLNDIPPEDMIERASTIVSVVWALYKTQLEELKELEAVSKLAVEVEWPLVNVLAKCEIEGVGLDTGYLAGMSERLGDRIEDLIQEVYGYADQEFNVSSPAQLAEVLFDKLGLPTKGVKKGKTGYSTAAKELEKLRELHPIINLITEYRELTKLKGTYVDPLPELVDKDSRLHSTFSTWVASTGRLSSHDPNLQNIPIRSEMGREVRNAFVARPGNTFVSADYSQFELRLAAVLAEDTELIEAFNDGLDIHTQTASQVYGVSMDDVTKSQRSDAKVINFGILYGMSPRGLSVATGMSLQDAKSFIDRYFELRKPILEYIETTRELAKDQGYVETMLGRRRPTPDVKSSNFIVREGAYRAAINMPVQGTEADLMKMAMIKVDENLDADCKQLLQIHDSILVECPEGKADEVAKMMRETMEGIYKLDVQLSVDVSIGKTWGEL